MSGPSGPGQDPWPSFVARVHGVIQDGLTSLAADTGTSGFTSAAEKDLNRELFFRMCRVATKAKQELHLIVPAPPLAREHTWDLAPTIDANNQPSPEDAQAAPREEKRPDFQWSFQDDQAEDLYRARRTYVVECKRLGKPSSSSWVLNRNYVEHGTRRFVEASHLYGKDDMAGGMIGYVQSMDVATISTEVNMHLASVPLPALPIPRAHGSSGFIHASEHVLSRTAARSPFFLRHFWVDLR